MNQNFIPPTITPIIALKDQLNTSKIEPMENQHTILGKRSRNELVSVEKSSIDYFNKYYILINSNKENLEKLYPKLYYHYMSMTTDEKLTVLDKKTHLYNEYIKLFNLN